MPPHALMALYREMENTLLWNWKPPIVNDFYVMIHYGLLKTLCRKWCGDPDGSLQNDLLCGEGNIRSTEPAAQLMAMAREIRRTPDLLNLFQNTPVAEISQIVLNTDAHPGFRQRVSDYLEAYGFRCMDELKLEAPSLKEQPIFLFQILANYLKMNDTEALDPAEQARRQQAIRNSAEQKAFAAFGPLKPVKAPIFRRVLENARKGVKNRENMRFARSQIYGLLRELLLAVGNRFASEGILENRDDIFYLALEEVWDFIKGTAVTTDLKGLAALRKAEFDGYRSSATPPDDRFETYGIAYHKNSFRHPAKTADGANGADLTGTGCCPGLVVGPVRKLVSPRSDMALDGEILAALRTDPGWVPLYPAISGLLVEHGSILSHSAVVAREMGIPTIVGIGGLMNAIEDGQMVAMDGRAGTVQVIKNA